MRRPRAEELRERLALEPHPTCGFVRESFRSAVRLPAEALPGFGRDHAAGSVLIFLVTPEASMALHRIRPEQMYHHYLGDPLEVILLPPGGAGSIEVAGSAADGLSPQVHIPGGTWHVSRLREGGEYALLATTEWPAVEPEDVETADVERLVTEFPGMEAVIRDFASGDAAPLRHRHSES